MVDFKMKLLVTVLYLLFAVVESGHTNVRKCGVVASGNPIHQHPWLVLLRYHYKGLTGGNVRCGGTLIGDRHILTAAHCVQYSPIQMLPRLGEYDVSSRKDCVDGVCADPVIHMALERVFIHPGYAAGRMKDDLAILVLETAAPYTDFIRPICLPSVNQRNPALLYASGFGETPNSKEYSDTKKVIPLPLYRHCRRVFMLSDDVICAGGLKGMDTCSGDSGGPLVGRADDVFQLWGVTKGGERRCGSAGRPGVYTSIAHHLHWIRKVIDMTSPKNDVTNLGHNLVGSYRVLIL